MASRQAAVPSMVQRVSDAEALGHDLLQVHPAPAHDSMHGALRAGFNELGELRQLLQCGWQRRLQWQGIAASGRNGTWTVIIIGRFAGGKLIEDWVELDWVELDRLGLFQQLGCIPTGSQVG